MVFNSSSIGICNGGNWIIKWNPQLNNEQC
jgi:hypothetical protein